MPSLVLRAGLLGLVALVLGAGPAGAHASLTGSDPADGASLEASPTAVVLTFSENVGNGQLVATAPDGTSLEVTRATASGNRLTGTVAETDQKGRYSLAYRVVSADGHPISGTIDYSVTRGRVVDQVAVTESESFIHRHSDHIFWGVLAAAVAVALLLVPLRRHDDADRP